MISLLKTVNPDEAQGVVKDVYAGFSEKLGKLPHVIRFHSASPRVYGYLMGLMNEFAGHSTLDPVLQAFLRAIVSRREGGEYCVKFQSFLLQAYGVPPEKIEKALHNPEDAPLADKQKHLLLFALRLIEGQTEATPEEIEKLHDMGWTDEEIYELCFLGGLQKGMVPLIKGFKVAHDF